MKKNMIVGAFLLVLLAASCAFAGAQDFVLLNKTGVDIYAVYIAPSNSDNWGEDVMPTEVLEDGLSATITFPAKNKAALWDIRVEDSDGDSLEWEEFNLFEISKVTLLKNGEAKYE